jgi:hypothetical protein
MYVIHKMQRSPPVWKGNGHGTDFHTPQTELPISAQIPGMFRIASRFGLWLKCNNARKTTDRSE